MNNMTFENIRSQLQALSVPSGQARNTIWLSKRIALARESMGNHEILLVGSPLSVTSSAVRRHIRYGSWESRDGLEQFAATLLALPSEPHFGSLAALIGTELLEHPLEEQADLQAAFAAVEPLIELAIIRSSLPENVILGLIGELTVLRQALAANRGEPSRRASILDCWQGWRDDIRDFKFGNASIEVKSTSKGSSIHDFSGLHQIEPVLMPDGTREQLFVLSLGLTKSDQVGESLPMIIDQVLDMLADPRGPEPLKTAFLEQIECYGTRSLAGYRHFEMRDWPAYSQLYTHGFPPRLYDMSDANMRVLHREDVERTFVDAATMSFTLHFPDRISDANPLDWIEVLTTLTG